MRFYANENFPLPVVIALRGLGHDVLTIQETGRGGQAVSDEMVLQFADEDQRVVLTFNRKHFIRLHTERPQHSGIIVCSFDPDFVALAERIHEAVTQFEEMTGQLIRVNRF